MKAPDGAFQRVAEDWDAERDELIGLIDRYRSTLPERVGSAHSHKPRFDARQVLEAISHELTVVCLIINRLAKSTVGDDQDRLILAAGRFSNALKLTQSLKSPPELKAIRRGS